MAIMLSLSGCVEKQASETPSQYLLINHSAELKDYIGRYTESLPGKTFLVIDMMLENHGYSTIDINPNYFAIVIDKVVYPYDKATYSTESPLTSSALLNGGKISGYLVFQIPSDKAQYTLVYAGPEKANVIYGKLQTAKTVQTESKTKKPSRNVSFILDGKSYAFTGGDYSTRVDTSNQGYVTQVTRLEQIISKNEPASFVEVNIKTIRDESLKPTNKDKAVNEATDSYIDGIKKHASGATIDEKPTYDVTLANGDKVTVHQFKKVPFVYNNNVNLFSYMPDSNTIATIASSENKQGFDEVIRSLNIEEIQKPQ
jgi:hypothetical protein